MLKIFVIGLKPVMIGYLKLVRSGRQLVPGYPTQQVKSLIAPERTSRLSGSPAYINTRRTSLNALNITSTLHALIYRQQLDIHWQLYQLQEILSLHIGWLHNHSLHYRFGLRIRLNHVCDSIAFSSTAMKGGVV